MAARVARALVAAALLVASASGLALPCPAGEWDGFPPSRRSEFMRDYWGRRPLLIRGLTTPQEAAIVGPDELAGLACEDGVEARIVCEKGLGPDPWALLHGPFEPEDFSHLPEGAPWALLVQEANLALPRAAALLQARLAHVPHWRADDVMVSYAEDGGGIGPHVDNYDVFLLQGGGSRRWCVQERTVPASEEGLVPGVGVRVLREFEADKSWVLQPGDCLYLPPRVPHRGVALGPGCVTVSVGYRAPGQQELLRAFGDWAAQGCAEDAFFVDTPGTVAEGADPEGGGQVPADALDALEALVADRARALLEDRAALRAWLAGQATRRRRAPLEFEGEHAELDREALLGELVDGAGCLGHGLALWRAEGVPFAWASAQALCRGPEAGPALFVDGKERAGVAEGAKAADAEACLRALCAHNPARLEGTPLAQCPGMVAALRKLCEEGLVYFAPREGETEEVLEGEVLE